MIKRLCITVILGIISQSLLLSQEVIDSSNYLAIMNLPFEIKFGSPNEAAFARGKISKDGNHISFDGKFRVYLSDGGFPQKITFYGKKGHTFPLSWQQDGFKLASYEPGYCSNYTPSIGSRDQNGYWMELEDGGMTINDLEDILNKHDIKYQVKSFKINTPPCGEGNPKRNSSVIVNFQYNNMNYECLFLGQHKVDFYHYSKLIEIEGAKKHGYLDSYKIHKSSDGLHTRVGLARLTITEVY